MPLAVSGADLPQLGTVVAQLLDGLHLLCQEVDLDEVTQLPFPEDLDVDHFGMNFNVDDRLGDMLEQVARLSLGISNEAHTISQSILWGFYATVYNQQSLHCKVNSEPGLESRIASNHASIFISDSTLDDAVYRRFND